MLVCNLNCLCRIPFLHLQKKGLNQLMYSLCLNWNVKNDLNFLLVQHVVISIEPNAPQEPTDFDTNELTVEDGRYFADAGTLVIVGTGTLDAEKEEVLYTTRNGNTFSGLTVLTSHVTGSNVYDLNSLNNFVSIIPNPPTITVCFDEALNTRRLVSYKYNSNS